MKFKYIGKVQSMAQNEILGMINPDTLARIKTQDQNPEIKVFCIGHEGTAKPNQIGYGQRMFQYFREAIYKLTENIREGTKAFLNHAVGTNSHEGRKAIGEIVGKTIKSINGQLSSLAAIYIYPEHRNEKVDVASFEGDVEFTVDAHGVCEVTDFKDISAVALGDSNYNKPAFAGATLLATMQAFQKQKGRGKFRYSKGSTMDLEEIKAAIKDGSLSPSDLFTQSQIEGDSTVKKIVNKAESTGYEHHRQKMERQIGKPIEEYIKDSDAKVKKLEDDNATLNSKLVTSGATGVIDSIITEKKIGEKPAAFIKKNAALFTSTAKTPEELKTQAGAFVENQLSSFKDMAALLGVKVDDTPAAPANKGTPAGDGKSEETPSSEEEKYIDPKTNDLIPQNT